MRLKSLELVGFKSFFDQTSISFAPGVTAVVGPNGCGKSNVVDAVRWVLGEQAPTRLRGKSAEDLIYAGNDSNPAAGMAEVSLIIEAEEDRPLPEPFSQLNEVAVTRRVYRSGDSEYLINRIPCRLKDITEFFMASQIHSRSFAIVEQGRIDEIVQSKPEEIRGMIEEAAGLSLFKGRRELSERKLERVRENLSRVDDVLAEIERQLNYARRQAKKAEAYRIIKGELSELERFQSARRILDQRLDLAAESEREQELRLRADSIRNQLDDLQAKSERAASEVQSSETELSSARRELDSIQAGAAERARTRDFLARRVAAIDESEPLGTARLAELEARAVLARASRAAAGASLARENNCEGGLEAELEDLRRQHQAMQAELKSAERGAEEFKDELSDTVSEAAVIRGRLGDLAGERAELQQAIDELAARAPELERVAAESRAAMGTAQEMLSSAQAELEMLEHGSREASERESQARAAIERLGARIAALSEAIENAGRRAKAAAESRGSWRPLRTVLESLNGDRPSADPELLANVVRAPAEVQPALHAVLGEDLEAVIVDSDQFAIRAIEILKEKEAGRLTFISEPEVAVAPHAPIEAPGITGRLIDMIGVDPRYQTLVERMLGHVMLADDVRSAIEASNLNGHGTLFVTREGDVIAPGRMIRGGSSNAAGAQIDDGGADALSETASELAHAQAKHEELIAFHAERAAISAQASSLLAQGRAGAQEAERAAFTARNEASSAEQALKLAHAQLDSGKRRLGEIAEQIASANARLEDLARVEQQSRAKFAIIRKELESQKAAFEDLAARMLDAGARVEARRSELASLEQEFRHATEIAREVEEQIDESAARILRAREERAEFAAELEKLALQDQQARARESELAESVARLEAQFAELSTALEARRAELKTARAELHAVETETVESSLKCERARTLIGELMRGFAEKFRCEFDEAASDLAAAVATRDGAADDARIAELRAKAERIGEVNLAAESEVKELEDRQTRLSGERADLENAVKDLSQTIAKLNREARKRFAETFEGAAKNFEELFPKLLPGGKGRLELAQSDDPLEAGVNIMVQPAGKKVKEIGLLSGGEKALSAMALIFSLFLLNPSPFCLMDEVDAPLDEFRLNAFAGLVQELKERSQFIIITHNQRTMQKADHIHGVTMDRPGVSRIISLKIPQAA